ncbi:ABC transporter substrate-binding protein [Rhodococcus sp. T2V]|uniref:ABC transporter substrate-binding protein n=1 Tax=Rhodococcus sp. T2V TaxID=3034164 RepID=UPI0023E1E02C|nr:ABC transporter substrate-binding protein [Rhodococcus sp. T2V]MDF3307055.1 ABC transporter substrate-binding protein [Rhodococcus sp. T2V]
MHILPRHAVIAGLVTLALVSTASCSSSNTQSRTDGLLDVTVGQLPIVDSVPFTFAVDKGFFREEGINATADFTNAGAMITNLVNGSDQFALGETAIVIQAFDKGLPLRIVGGVTKSTDLPAEDTGVVLVAENSAVKTPADLTGRTVAVGALKGSGELSLRAALDKAGADSHQVKFLEMPLSDMTDALAKGHVDAISTISPFDTAALAQGATRLMSPGAEAVPGGMQLTVATSQKFEQENPEAVQGFVRALNRGIEYAAAHPDEVRAVLPTISPVPAELIPAMRLPVFDAGAPRAALTLWTGLMEQYQFVSGDVDVDELMS